VNSTISSSATGQPRLVAHVIQRLAVGGLENGLVNLINHMPPNRYRHAIICLSTATDYAGRIERDNVPVIELHKRPGQDLGVHGRYYKVLRSLRPDIVHTRNLAALEFQPGAALAKVPGRIHGEHGRDIYDLDGTNFKYQALRKLTRGFIHHYIAVSRDLSRWLVDTLKTQGARVSQIYNGVDTMKFRPLAGNVSAIIPPSIRSQKTFVIGTVGRMEAVKDQLILVQAFLRLLEIDPKLRDCIRLVIVGNGPLREQAIQMLKWREAEQLAWLPGERSDIPELLRAMDLFVLPSLSEGISNTILEAMATGLPVIATDVGGNPELVRDGETGMLVPHSDPDALAKALHAYCIDRGKGRSQGLAGRKTVEASFGLSNMVDRYADVYDRVLAR
jgi:sugar transferase (PEP-CTERM/EpsH1 system associated)